LDFWQLENLARKPKQGSVNVSPLGVPFFITDRQDVLDSKGCFQLGNQTYYVKQQLRGQMVLIWVDGQKKQRITKSKDELSGISRLDV
jgi:hypothetical protein